MKDVDIGDCLRNWPYDPEKNVRMGRGADGREIILVRQPMGLEQYEVEGHPVRGVETVIGFHQARSEAEKRTGSAMGFELTAEDCAALFREASAYHHRLTVLFRLKDWPRAGRDAAQILSLLKFTTQYARCEEDRVQLEQWCPLISHLHAAARALGLLDQRQYREAFKAARDLPGISEIPDNGEPGCGKLAEALHESVREALAKCPAFQPAGESSFLCQDDYWTIRYHGHTAFLKATRGLQCLALLLRTPGREFHVSELIASLPEAPADAGGGLRETGERFVMAGLYDAGPVLDAQAKAECKRRLDELRQEMGEAERFSDLQRVAKAENEMNAISQHLASAVGLGGRDRKTSSEAERARCAVTKRIKLAIQKIGEAIPALGHHLAARIKTGYFCSYNPHPDRPVAWKF